VKGGGKGKPGSGKGKPGSGNKRPEKLLTGRQAAKLVRKWLSERYPPEVVDILVEGLPWKDNPEPMGTLKALRWTVYFNIMLPLDISRTYPRDDS